MGAAGRPGIAQAPELDPLAGGQHVGDEGEHDDRHHRPGPVQPPLRRPTDLGFVGDWNGNGTWTPGVLRAGAKWYLKDSFTGSTAKLGLRKQTPGTPVVGDWDNRP